MRKVIILATLLFLNYFQIKSQENSTLKGRAIEWGMGTSNFKSFNISFKAGGKKNWYYRAKALELFGGRDSTSTQDTATLYKNWGMGLSTGLEKRFYSNEHLSWGIGMDVFLKYQQYKDIVGEDNKGKKISAFKNKTFVMGLAIPIMFNYQFAEDRIMCSFEFAPSIQRSKNTLETNNSLGEPIENLTSTNFETEWYLLNMNQVSFSVAYRFLK